MKTVAVIDYGMGNLHSVAKAVESLSKDVLVQVSCDAQTILQADRIIFPGVGAIRDCMAEIRRLGVDEILRDAIRNKPVLAICVGMQALMEHSEENGLVECLGLVKGRVRHFGNSADVAFTDSDGQRLKVPHMGWNCVEQSQAHALWQGIEDNSRFYFVHSYYVEPDPQVSVTGVTDYGVRFCSAFSQGNIFAVQFHPEKSQHSGLQLLSNFLKWEGE
jgi:imidazole glycerol-phosphate synthase subunit HisH